MPLFKKELDGIFLLRNKWNLFREHCFFINMNNCSVQSNIFVIYKSLSIHSSATYFSPPPLFCIHNLSRPHPFSFKKLLIFFGEGLNLTSVVITNNKLVSPCIQTVLSVGLLVGYGLLSFDFDLS